MYQPMPGKPYQELTVKVNNQKLTAIDKFTYLGSTLSHSVHIDDETNVRIAKASAVFGRLRHQCGNAEEWASQLLLS